MHAGQWDRQPQSLWHPANSLRIAWYAAARQLIDAVRGSGGRLLTSEGFSHGDGRATEARSRTLTAADLGA